MSRVRFLVALGALAVLLAAGALAASSVAVDFSSQAQDYWNTQPMPEGDDPDLLRVNWLQTMSSVLVQFTPWVLLAATIPVVGALALGTWPTRRGQLAGSASATASRVASSAASVSAGSAESIS